MRSIVQLADLDHDRYGHDCLEGSYRFIEKEVPGATAIMVPSPLQMPYTTLMCLFNDGSEESEANKVEHTNKSGFQHPFPAILWLHHDCSAPSPKRMANPRYAHSIAISSPEPSFEPPQNHISDRFDFNGAANVVGIYGTLN